MTNPLPNDHSKRAFVIYARDDREIAYRIRDRLRECHLRLMMPAEGLPADEPLRLDVWNLSPGDYVILLLSPASVHSRWVREGLTGYLGDQEVRDVALLPVLVEDCEFPEFVRSMTWFDLRNQSAGALDELIGQIMAIAYLDFSKLDARSFDRLIQDLLQRMDFTTVVSAHPSREANDKGYDFVAERKSEDPFGHQVNERWFVQTKFFPGSIPDLRSAHAFTLLRGLLPPNAKLLLITNGQFTSVARDWLSETTRHAASDVQILEGHELKRLLLKHSDLASRYFSSSPEPVHG